MIRWPLRIAGVCEETFTPATITHSFGPASPDVFRVRHAEVAEQRSVEARDVAGGVQPEDLELRPHDLGVGVVPEDESSRRTRRSVTRASSDSRS